MNAAEFRALVEGIHSSGRQFVLSLTGGGSGALSALLQVPGASATVLEAVVPYSATAFDDWMGGRTDQYCSQQTARAMAMRAFERARQLSSADRRWLCGIGATASLATNRPKRGAHRIHVARQSATMTAVATCNFVSAGSTRDEEERVATKMILHSVAKACGVQPEAPVASSLEVEVSHREQPADGCWTELLLNERKSVLIAPRDASATTAILFPGAFNPPHWGHERMAQIASQRYGGGVTFELSMCNVDKQPLDFIAIADRLRLLAEHPVLLTRAPTFVEKSEIAPGCVFVVGVDTIERIADADYYHGDRAERDAAIAAIIGRGCRFLVFGRAKNGTFSTLSAVQIPAPLRAICEEVPEAEFNARISSTELRAKGTARPPAGTESEPTFIQDE